MSTNGLELPRRKAILILPRMASKDESRLLDEDETEMLEPAGNRQKSRTVAKKNFLTS